jgi:hypothetical protein
VNVRICRISRVSSGIMCVVSCACLAGMRAQLTDLSRLPRRELGKEKLSTFGWQPAGLTGTLSRSPATAASSSTARGGDRGLQPGQVRVAFPVLPRLLRSKARRAGSHIRCRRAGLAFERRAGLPGLAVAWFKRGATRPVRNKACPPKPMSAEDEFANAGSHVPHPKRQFL